MVPNLVLSPSLPVELSIHKSFFTDYTALFNGLGFTKESFCQTDNWLNIFKIEDAIELVWIIIRFHPESTGKGLVGTSPKPPVIGHHLWHGWTTC